MEELGVKHGRKRGKIDLYVEENGVKLIYMWKKTGLIWKKRWSNKE